MPLHIVIYLVLQDVVDDSDGCGGKFTVLIVSDKFEGKGILQRHRLVHQVLAEEIKQIHAFTQKTLTSTEWTEQEKSQ
ncbi:bolA-like protein 2 isoform X1 [Diaphorina citri]|uniref:BolA-like protein 2 isoform X1 n=1 Tax=Diaphorina citri TaxID=121845 RepID=A0A3Q0JCX8_DIACI|nr:bolA-like protein 2 isoform X1 [Diaphorina citri]